jgi:triosephosphate isomerase
MCVNPKSVPFAKTHLFGNAFPRLNGRIVIDVILRQQNILIGGNWEMYKDPAETTSFFKIFRPLVERSAHCEIVICPSFLDVQTAATRGTRIQIGAQTPHVILGHSERRRYFGETNERTEENRGGARRLHRAELNHGWR